MWAKFLQKDAPIQAKHQPTDQKNSMFSLFENHTSEVEKQKLRTPVTWRQFAWSHIAHHGTVANGRNQCCHFW